MIVRIATEGQYRLDDGAGGRLNELDNAAVTAVEGGDEDGFHSVFEEMLELVRRSGQPLGEDELEESDLIMPPPDLSFVEAGEHFSGEGLIPD